jgi:hypothetical protein
MYVHIRDTVHGFAREPIDVPEPARGPGPVFTCVRVVGGLGLGIQVEHGEGDGDLALRQLLPDAEFLTFLASDQRCSGCPVAAACVTPRRSSL